jgi:flavin-dependent dehydrogenase
MGAAEVCIVGGGPAGLAAAIAFRRRGIPVALFDHAEPPIDKACGEGLMPDGVSALEELGVSIPAGTGFSFPGIRFLDGNHSVAAEFPGRSALGLRRTALHDLLRAEAVRAGAAIYWGIKRVRFVDGKLDAEGKIFSPRLIVAADGLQSAIRRAAGLDESPAAEIRYGFRRHYPIAPWTRYMELLWGKRAQLYVTPISDGEIGVAVLSREPKMRLADALEEFPGARRRLEGVEPSTSERGSLTISRRLKRVTNGRVALLGDASGSVDAITGDGLALSFRQAIALAEAYRNGDLSAYERKHRKLLRRANRMASLLLLIERRPRLRAEVLAYFEKHPAIFARLLSIHAGEEPSLDLPPGLQNIL